MSNSLRLHEPQQARPPCPSPTPRVHPNPCPLSWWCHPTISSSVVPFSSCPQSFPASGSFQMSQLFASGGQSIRVSASKSVLPRNTQDSSPLGWTGWISLQSKGLSRVFSNTKVQKHQFFSTQLSSQSNSHIINKKIIKANYGTQTLYDWSHSLSFTHTDTHTHRITVSWYQHYGEQYGDSLKNMKENHHMTQQSYDRAYAVLSCFSHVQLCMTLCSIVHQAPLSMGFSRQRYWSGLPFPSSGDLPDPGIKLTSLISPALASGFLTTSTQTLKKP